MVSKSAGAIELPGRVYRHMRSFGEKQGVCPTIESSFSVSFQSVATE